jgi:hypothetical protein
MKEFTLRVVIDTKEDVFRDIVITDNFTFEELHYSILDSFGFDASQLASFYLSNDEWDQGDEIALMHTPSENPDEKSYAMADTLLSQLILAEGQKLLYVYDFMSMWCFYVELIKIAEPNSATQYPLCTTSFGDAPKQDSKMSDVVLSEDDMLKALSEEDEFEDEEEDDIFDEFDDYDTYEY